ncbi:syntaxin-binding protein tomosyn isoform X1 [Dermatophagoides pteronyssinus]|uniref:Syntaxin-binding protein 5-like isoform X1 n=1 Tax=Dermatophagoides pteronyssinus TaxID=6956 RepID=A0A6P6XN32_DERPT|nr:syntaxin-binding protein 5-like isoform X1 [Dermatophagoides pteronyssinus]
MKKSGFFRGVFDGIRSTVGQPSSSSSSLSGAKAFLESETEEVLKPSHFKINTIVQHGFPYQPTSIAFDPIQRLIAIGSKNGSLRILGRPGVDISLRHVTEFAVLQIIFIINEGQLITVCADDSIHLWNLRNKSPEIVHSLKFQKERISYCYLPFQSKWMYIGTERGNVYVVNIDTFAMSGHVINWNKAIEISRKTHPGSIIHLSDCPIDSNKLLIGYDSGIIVLWDLRNKSADFRHSYPEGILSISWHSEGRQFICSHADGSLSTWNLKAGSRPQSSIYPLAKSGDPKSELYSKIPKVEWRTSRTGDAYIMFSGGLVVGNGGEGANSKRVLTVIHGKSPTMLEMEHDIIDFITLCESPYEADFNDPYAIVVLLSNDLVVVNLQQPGYPCYTNPYPMDLHESPVTYCYYLANCPPDLIHAFYTVGQKSNKRSGMLERDWPINGGEWGSSTVSYPEIIITGHADGSLKFWDASAVNLQILYKLKTAKLFEKPRLINISQSFNNQNNNNNNNNNNGNNNNNNNNNSNNNNTTNNNGTSEMEDLFAIEFLTFSAENRVLCIAGASSQVIVFRFSKQEAQSEITVIEVPMNYDEIDSQSDSEILSGASALLHKADTHDPSAYYPLKVRTGHHKRLSGFQAEIVCLSPWIDRKTPPYRITSMSYNMHANLFAYGTENSLVIIDLVQKSIVLNVSTASLYGTSDPYQRTRPKRCTSAGPHSKDSNDHNNDVDRCRSPITTDNESMETVESLPKIIDYKDYYCDEEIEKMIEELSGMSSTISLTQSSCSDEEESKSSSLLKQQSQSLDIESLTSSSSSSASSTALSTITLANNDDDDHNKDDNNRIISNDETSSLQQITEMKTKKSIDDNQSNEPIESLDESQSPSSSPPPKAPPRRKHNNQNMNKFDTKNILIKSDSDCLINQNDNDNKQDNDDVDDDKLSLHLSQSLPQTSSSMLVHSISLPEPSSSSSNSDNNNKQKNYTGWDTFKKYGKHKIFDLRNDNHHGSSGGSFISLINKIEGFTRSRSSSMSSLENVGSEPIQFLIFANTYVLKTDTCPSPTLWVGTSCGTVIVITLTMPDSMDNRVLCLQTVLATPSPTIFRLKGSILNIGFLDLNGCSLPLSAESWKDNNKRNETSTPTSISESTKRTGSLTITRTGSGGSSSNRMSKTSPTSSTTDVRDSHLVVLTSEKQIRLIVMPQQICAQKAVITETSFAVRADLVFIKNQDAYCLAVYLGTGNIVVYSLPSLRILIDQDFLPLTDVRIARTILFSVNGHGMYLSSPSELTKFTILASFCDNLPDMIGSVYNGPKDLPEPPKQSFLKGFFGGTPTPLDREELFGETNAGKAPKTMARLIPGSVEHTKAQSSAIGGEFAKLKESLNERGERLGKLEDSTARMQNEAEAFGSMAHAVMLKYRDKKWYQF